MRTQPNFALKLQIRSKLSEADWRRWTEASRRKVESMRESDFVIPSERHDLVTLDAIVPRS
jgi:hypothetical protein